MTGNSLRFSTNGLAPKDRFSFWREVFGRSIVRLDFESVNDIPFQAEATLYGFDGLGIALGSTTGLRSSRTKELLADGADDLIVSITLAGTCRATQSRRELTIETGEATLLTVADVGSSVYPQSSRILNLRVPRRSLTALVANPEAAVMQRVPADTEVLQLLIDYVTMAVSRHSLADVELRRVLGTHVHDLVALMVGATRDGIEIAGSRGLRMARLNAIKSDIMARLSNEKLSVGEIATRHRMTPRYVQLLFESEGKTFSEYLVEQRLQRAYRMLTNSVGWTIGSIAFEVGFSNLSYFNRTFRRRYGMTPSDVREAARR